MPKQQGSDNAQFLRKQRAAIEAIAGDNLALKQQLVLENRASGAPTSSAAAALITELRGQADTYTVKITEVQRHRDELKHQAVVLRERIAQQRQLMGGVGASAEQELQARRRVALLEDRLQQAAQRSSEAATRTAQLRTRVDGLRRDRLAYGELRAKQERSLRRAQRRMADLLGAVAESLDARHKAILLQAQVRARAEREATTCESEWQQLTQAIEADRRVREQRREQENQRRSQELAALVTDARTAQQAQHSSQAQHEGRRPSAAGAAPLLPKIDPIERTRRVQQAIQQVLTTTGLRSVEELLDSIISSEEEAGRLFSYASALSAEADGLEQRVRQETAQLEAQSAQRANAQHDHRTKALQELDHSLAEAERSAEAAEARERHAAQAMAGLLAAVADMDGTTRRSDEARAAEPSEGEEALTERNLMRHLGAVEMRATWLLQKYCTLLIDDQEVAAEHAIAILGGAHQGAGLGPVRYAIDPPSVSAADNPGNDHATASWKLAAGKSRAAVKSQSGKEAG